MVFIFIEEIIRHISNEQYKTICVSLFSVLFSADHGGDCESVCTVINAYASQCQTLIKTPTINWRRANRCPVQCESDKVYMACGPRCPQTCFRDPNEYAGCIADSGCVDGCFCPYGKVMDNHGQCIEPAQCPCLHEERIYPQNSRILMRYNDTCQQECECQNGSFICQENQSKLCTTTNCTSNQFTCQSTGQCIPWNWQCDGIRDCADGSDELRKECENQCSNHTATYQCETGQCINSIHRCDGLPDCRDGSDELNCSKTNRDKRAERISMTI
jgi:hypothetical protein